jgi:BolA protein
MRPSNTELHARLSAHFPDARIDITDDSAAHAGHAGAQGGAGHYSVHIESSVFRGQSSLARHRLVYDAVHDWIPSRIHALRISAVSPDDLPAPSKACMEYPPTR